MKTCSVCDGKHHAKGLCYNHYIRSWNLQLLCPTCNQQKNAHDPIDFMQSRGFLL